MTSKEYDKLSDEEKRIKVAELCRWQCRAGLYNKSSDKATWEWHHEDLIKIDGDEYWYSIDILPDYLNDLNACHEFESFTDPGLWDKYDNWLETVTRQARVFKWYATAAQRCKAFVLTMTGG